MLNTLANHGMLPRDGRNLTAWDFADTLKTYLNLEWKFWWVVAQTTIETVKAQDPVIVDLNDINFYNGIQHGNDKGWGDHFTRRNASLVEQLMALSETVDGVATLSYKSMAQARLLREYQSEKWGAPPLQGNHEDTVATASKKFLAVDQAGIPLLLLSDPVPGQTEKTGVVSTERLSHFFMKEELPFVTGWKPSEFELTGEHVFKGIFRLQKDLVDLKNERVKTGALPGSPNGLTDAPYVNKQQAY
ncbi:hypothetical protein DFS34DRAFT_480947 [Phlyctochytrium arcticum]|nr:hypothetical protein DFS34DRAFT_598463 [Phlyctochytrium arcticum]KAI9088047.1 hypothetical protein DFS34DRAFT_480947 [Phlyctochytrium arcticum]